MYDTLEELRIPVLSIDGRDYSLSKRDDGYFIYDQNDDLVIQFAKTRDGDFTVVTSDGKGGNLCCERDKFGQWFALYRAPLRTRNIIPFGRDNAVIKASEIIITSWKK